MNFEFLIFNVEFLIMVFERTCALNATSTKHPNSHNPIIKNLKFNIQNFISIQTHN
mgnify:CR=1 FL=1